MFPSGVFPGNFDKYIPLNSILSLPYRPTVAATVKLNKILTNFWAALRFCPFIIAYNSGAETKIHSVVSNLGLFHFAQN